MVEVQLQGGTPSFVAQLHHWASTFPVEESRGTDIRLMLTQSDALQLPTVRSDLSPSPQVIGTSDDGRTQSMEWQYFTAQVTDHRWDALISARPPALEHVVRAALAHWLLFDRGLMFHAATLRFGEHTLMFAGHPNAGKSTLSVEGRPDEILSNEISVISRDEDGVWTAWPSPFWGSGDVPQPSRPHRLSGVAVLQHDYTRNTWQPLAGVQALVALAPHVGCQTADQAASPHLLTALRQLQEDLPVLRFGWLRTADPLQDSPWKHSSP